MSKESRVNRFKTFYQQFKDANPRNFLDIANNFADYDGLSFDEAKKTLEMVLEILDNLLEEDSLEYVAWHAFNSLESIMQGVVSTYNQFNGARDQNTFQSFAQNLDSLAYHLNMFGLTELARGGAQLQKTSAALRDELGSLVTARAEAEQLKGEIKTLIAPAVAGSLSESFTARKNTLYQGRKIWGIATAVFAIICLWLTYDFANNLAMKLEPKASISSATQNTRLGQPTNKTAIDSKVIENNSKPYTELIWPTFAIRTIVLIPAYLFFGFAFGQYKKEREFEEEYAHKAAVATSLPNYGDLTREPSVRDQIVTGATNVIFSSPVAKNQDKGDSNKTIDNMKTLIDAITKVLPHKE